MAEEFVSLGDGGCSEMQAKRERVKHLLIGSPAVVKRTIYLLHIKGYAEVREWSKPLTAGGLGDREGDVIAILLRHLSVE
ncbi:hypothetical protein HC928_23245 [bacterium]|nr:hypothetical protein [bacterium]